MVDISIVGDELHMEVKGWDKLWAFKGKLELPLKHIRNVYYDPRATAGWWHGIKLAGTNVPGILTAGTFYERNGEKVFWDVHDPQQTIVIELHDERYSELIVEVENPQAALEQIRGAIGPTGTVSGG